MSQVRVKVYHQDQIRRFTINTSTDLKTFKSVIEEFYPKISQITPVFKYEDEEGEFITFSTEMEWTDALKQNVDVLRIYVEEIKEKKCEKKCKKSREKHDFKVKPGDIVYELSESEVSDYLRTGEININLPSGHQHIVCDGCEKSGFSGTRYHCLGCKDFDFCEACHKTFGEKHYGGSHKFEEIPDKRFGEVVAHIVHEDDQEKKDRKLAKQIRREERLQEKLLAKQLRQEEKALKKEEKEIKREEKDLKKELKVEKKEIKEEVKVVPLYPVIEEKKTLAKPILEVVQPTAPKEDAKPVALPIRDEKYSIHYKILENMGFVVSDLTTSLLKKHNGNLQNVVDEMLKQ